MSCQWSKFIDIFPVVGASYFYSDNRWWPRRLFHWLGNYDPIADAIKDTQESFTAAENQRRSVPFGGLSGLLGLGLSGRPAAKGEGSNG